ncbi:hypothetical protein CGC21_29495 [Leishmania donovani]|uniref:Uncharacterized protein n=1 Tax=Leishmania donovani TaxID=5661 RepID=A0A504XN23_LEIDO|nr:hypothetical protein CGC21_29495 [Leishmania donovani]
MPTEAAQKRGRVDPATPRMHSCNGSREDEVNFIARLVAESSRKLSHLAQLLISQTLDHVHGLSLSMSPCNAHASNATRLPPPECARAGQRIGKGAPTDVEATSGNAGPRLSDRSWWVSSKMAHRGVHRGPAPGVDEIHRDSVKALPPDGGPAPDRPATLTMNLCKPLERMSSRRLRDHLAGKPPSPTAAPYARVFGCVDHSTEESQAVGPYRTRWVMDYLHAETRKGHVAAVAGPLSLLTGRATAEEGLWRRTLAQLRALRSRRKRLSFSVVFAPWTLQYDEEVGKFAKSAMSVEPTPTAWISDPITASQPPGGHPPKIAVQDAARHNERYSTATVPHQ